MNAQCGGEMDGVAMHSESMAHCGGRLCDVIPGTL